MKKTASQHHLRRAVRPFVRSSSVTAEVSASLNHTAAPSLEQLAVQVLTSVTDEGAGSVQAATRLLSLTRTVASAHAVGLYRTVQETGLLVPLGDVAVNRSGSHKLKGNLSGDRLTMAMTSSADHAAKSFLYSIGDKDKAGGRRQLSSSDKPFRSRTTGPEGVAIWATVITRRDDITIESDQAPPGAAPGQLLGV